jgi:hypothetical protein
MAKVDWTLKVDQMEQLTASGGTWLSCMETYFNGAWLRVKAEEISDEMDLSGSRLDGP